MNSMYTTCPGCRMNLALTPKDLRVGQGYVRCGRCERVFNALLSLSEEVDETAEPALRATGTTTLPALAEDAPAPAALPAAAYDLGDASDDPLAEGDGEVDVVERLPTGSYETIVLEGDTFLQTEEMVDEAEIDQQIEQIARQINDNANAADEAAAAEEIDAAAALGNRPKTPRIWSIGAGLLALLLLGQVMHHYRHELVTVGWLQRPLQAVYGVFGKPLEPAWDLAAYDLRQLGGDAQPGAARMVIRATVLNRSPLAQPPPLIQVILQDRYGNAFSTRVIPPADYVLGAPPSRMDPDQRLDAQLTLDDPTSQLDGWLLDTCLADTAGALHCTNAR